MLRSQKNPLTQKVSIFSIDYSSSLFFSQNSLELSFFEEALLYLCSYVLAKLTEQSLDKNNQSPETLTLQLANAFLGDSFIGYQ